MFLFIYSGLGSNRIRLFTLMRIRNPDPLPIYGTGLQTLHGSKGEPPQLHGEHPWLHLWSSTGHGFSLNAIRIWIRLFTLMRIRIPLFIFVDPVPDPNPALDPNPAPDPDPTY